MIEIFEKLNIGDFVVRINNRKILKGLLQALSIQDDKSKDVLDALDDLEKIGQEGVEKKLNAQGLSSDQVEKLIDAINNGVSALERLDSPILQDGKTELEEVESALESMGVSSDKYKIDLSIVRGLDYYTGTVFETSLIGDGAVKGMSLCSGGRYDDLGEVVSGKPIPGVGASIGLTRLLHMLFDAGMIQPDGTPSLKVLVLPFSVEQMNAALALGSEIRKQGIVTDVYLEDKKLGKKFDYADKIGVEWVVILGEKEVEAGTIQLKNMKTGESEVVSLEDLVKKVS